MLVAALLSATRIAAGVEFASSVEVARQQGDAAKPVVVTFSAAWCGWCRKMAATTFPDPKVTAVADQYLWVRLDADAEPELAARWRVQGLPHTLLLDSEDRVLGSQPGYMTAEALVAFLADSLANPQPIDGVPQRLLDRLASLPTDAEPTAAVQEAVTLLSRRDVPDREQLMDALRSAGPATYPVLVVQLQDERLAVRAAAAGVLHNLTSADLPFDPFAPQAKRSEQATAWSAWVKAQPVAP